MSDPTITVEIAFGYTWQDTSPVWTDVSEWVEFSPGLSIDRGRSRELDTFGTGTAQFVLRNDDRRFDPSYAAGPYFGDLKPNVPVRILAEYNAPLTIGGEPVTIGGEPVTIAHTYDLFRGFIDGWPQAYTSADDESFVSISASDAFKLLGALDLLSTFFTLDSATQGVLDADRLAGDEGFTFEELSGARVETLLELAAWPDAYQDISTGVTMVGAKDINDSALAAMQNVEESEDGFLYMEADNKVTFIGRHDRQYLTRMLTSQVEFSDDGDYPYDDLTYVYDYQLIFNDVRRTREGGLEQVAEDAGSVVDYFRRSNSKTGMVMSTDNVALDLANVFLERYREPVLRIDNLVIDPNNNADLLWPEVLGRKLLDRVTVARTPQGVGAPISQQLHIQGLKHTYSMFKWRTTYYVTPVDTFLHFTLDSASLGALNDDRLGG